MESRVRKESNRWWIFGAWKIPNAFNEIKRISQKNPARNVEFNGKFRWKSEKPINSSENGESDDFLEILNNDDKISDDVCQKSGIVVGWLS